MFSQISKSSYLGSPHLLAPQSVVVCIESRGGERGNKGRRGGGMQRKEKKEDERSSREGNSCGLDFPGKLLFFPIDFPRGAIDFEKTGNGISLCWEKGGFKSLPLGGTVG